MNLSIAADEKPIQTTLFIGGERVSTAATSAITDPANPTAVVGFAARSTAADAERAVQSAHTAEPGWRALTAQQRAELLAHAVASNEQHREADARLLTLEIGKTLHESIVDLMVFDIRWHLALADADQVNAVEALEPTPGSPARTEIHWQPLGTVTIIIPFNWPLTILAASLPHALLAGNCVVVKPPRTAPLATTVFLERIASELPAGVLNVVTGDDDAVAPLIEHPLVRKVCFTGSVAAGKAIMAAASPSLTRLTLELGGNDAALLLADAPLDEEHINRLFHSIFDTSGQICMNAKRVYVHESRFDELVERLSERLEQVQLGHGLDKATSHGPVHSARQRDEALTILDDARTRGGEVREFGQLPEDADGYFVRPALVLDPEPSARIVTEEPFAPIVPIIRFSEEAEAIALANDSWAGLGASVWTADPATANRVAAQLVAGYVWVNDHGAPRLDLRAPFGGMKSSGFGREQGTAGLRAFMDTRAVSTTPDGLNQ